ncbi:MAG: DUF488 family protein [archaeon]|nr:DUF488 family protein [archaeon]
MIYKRQKLLLQIAQTLSDNNIKSKTYLVKAIFLLKQRFGNEHIDYDFFPYKHGPFSNEIYQDFNLLKTLGLFDQENLYPTKEGKKLIEDNKRNNFVFDELKSIISNFNSRKKLVDFVYHKYPEFTIRSEEKPKVNIKENGIFSIGYEGKTIDFFLNELIQNNISLLIDVRKNAFSMKKNFSKNHLIKCLKNSGINYLHFPELGIDSDKRKNLETVKDYQKLFEEYKQNLEAKKQEITKIKELGQTQKIALMCFEADKNFCHRGILSDFLNQKVVHI